MQRNEVLEFCVAKARAHSCYLIRNLWLNCHQHTVCLAAVTSTAVLYADGMFPVFMCLDFVGFFCVCVCQFYFTESVS